MAFLPRTWLRALWGVKPPAVELAPPIDCEECRVARVAGKDACPEHHHHTRPHVYRMGHEVEWGGVFDHPLDTLPHRESEEVEDIDITVN